jgi:RNA recognition motif-containing protein
LFQLEPYMTETFVKNAFEKLGEAPMGVKIMRNKFTGEPAGYCFVHFKTDEIALDAMHKLNGKVIPASNPVSLTIIWKSMQIIVCFSACPL